MSIFRLTFTHGMQIDLEAERFDDDGQKLTLYDGDGNLVASYIDGDIVSCEGPGVEGARFLVDIDGGSREIAADRMEADGPVIKFYSGDDSIVACFRKVHVTSVIDQGGL